MKLLYFLFVSFFLFWLKLPKIFANQQCCQKKIISSPVQYAGTYSLLREVTEEIDDNCIDGCIYFKEGEPNVEYCFQDVPAEDGASVSDQCDSETETLVGR